MDVFVDLGLFKWLFVGGFVFILFVLIVQYLFT